MSCKEYIWSLKVFPVRSKTWDLTAALIWGVGIDSVISPNRWNDSWCLSVDLPSFSDSISAHHVWSTVFTWKGFSFCSGKAKGLLCQPITSISRPLTLAGAVGGNEARLSNFSSHVITPAEMEAFKQRHSYPDRLVWGRSSDILSVVWQPMSHPSWNECPGTEEWELSSAAAIGATFLEVHFIHHSSPPSKDSSRGETKGHKDSDEEKSDRNRTWWKYFVSAMSETPIIFRKKKRKKTRIIWGLTDSQYSQMIPALGSVHKLRLPRIFYTDTGMPKDWPQWRSNGKLWKCRPWAMVKVHGSPQDKCYCTSQLVISHTLSQTAHPQASAFSSRDAKKKLTLVLCSMDSVAFPVMIYSTRDKLLDHTDREDNEIVCFLKVQVIYKIRT